MSNNESFDELIQLLKIEPSQRSEEEVDKILSILITFKSFQEVFIIRLFQAEPK